MPAGMYRQIRKVIIGSTIGTFEDTIDVKFLFDEHKRKSLKKHMHILYAESSQKMKFLIIFCDFPEEIDSANSRTVSFLKKRHLDL